MWFIVYQKRGYVDIIATAAERSMQAAVEEIQVLPEYSSKGEVLFYNLCLSRYI